MDRNVVGKKKSHPGSCQLARMPKAKQKKIRSSGRGESPAAVTPPAASFLPARRSRGPRRRSVLGEDACVILSQSPHLMLQVFSRCLLVQVGLRRRVKYPPASRQPATSCHPPASTCSSRPTTSRHPPAPSQPAMSYQLLTPSQPATSCQPSTPSQPTMSCYPPAPNQPATSGQLSAPNQLATPSPPAVISQPPHTT